MTVRPALLHKIIGVAAFWVWLTLFLRFYIGAQLAHAEGYSFWLGVLSSLGFFTVLSIFLIALSLSAIFLRSITGPVFAFFRHPSVVSALTTSIILVALVYALVLRQLWQPQGLRYWVDISLHYIIPLLFILVWWLLVPAHSLRWRDVIYWLGYPLIYILVVYVRGAVTGFYPYPFVNVAELGWWRVLLNSFFLLLLFAFIGLVLVVVDAYRKRKHSVQP